MTLNELELKNIIKDIGAEYVPDKKIKQKLLSIILKLLGLNDDKPP